MSDTELYAENKMVSLKICTRCSQEAYNSIKMTAIIQ